MVKRVVGIILLVVVSSVLACDMYNDHVLGNRLHRTPCSELPTRQLVEATLRNHSEVVVAIKQLRSPNTIVVEIGEPCPGKADLVIYHPDRQTRRQIENIIDSDTFFGVPYRLINI